MMLDCWPESDLDATEIRPQPAWNDAGCPPAQPRRVRRAPLVIVHDLGCRRSASCEQERFRSLTYVNR